MNCDDITLREEHLRDIVCHGEFHTLAFHHGIHYAEIRIDIPEMSLMPVCLPWRARRLE